MNVERVVVFNTETEEIGEIRRSLFESEVFNPGGLLLLEVEDTRSGCIDCGVEPSEVPEEDDEDAILEETATRVFGEPQTVVEYELPGEEED